MSCLWATQVSRSYVYCNLALFLHAAFDDRRTHDKSGELWLIADIVPLCFPVSSGLHCLVTPVHISATSLCYLQALERQLSCETS